MCGGFEIPLFWSELLSLFKSRQNKYIQWEAPKSNGAILCQVKLSQHAAAVKTALCLVHICMRDLPRVVLFPKFSFGFKYWVDYGAKPKS